MQLALDARLRAFAAVARRLSFSRAADDLFISQPAVSRHIAELEARLALQLVERRPHEVRLTSAGAHLARAVLRAETLLAQAERGLDDFRGHGERRLAIAASGTPGTYLLPPIIAAFHQQRPGLQLELLLATSAIAAEHVRAHRAEFGVVGGFAAAAELEARHLVDDELLLVAAPGAFPAGGTREELERATWVSREEGSATRAALEAAWMNIGLSPVSRLELPSWEAVKLVVACGGSIAACSRLAIEVELRAGTLCIVPVPGWTLTRAISLITPRDAPLTPAASAFCDLLLATLAG